MSKHGKRMMIYFFFQMHIPNLITRHIKLSEDAKNNGISDYLRRKGTNELQRLGLLRIERQTNGTFVNVHYTVSLHKKYTASKFAFWEYNLGQEFFMRYSHLFNLSHVPLSSIECYETFLKFKNEIWCDYARIHARDRSAS